MTKTIAHHIYKQKQKSGQNQFFAPFVATRQQRRKAILILVKQLDAIILAERHYCFNISGNMQLYYQCVASEQVVIALEEALRILKEAFIVQPDDSCQY